MGYTYELPKHPQPQTIIDINSITPPNHQPATINTLPLNFSLTFRTRWRRRFSHYLRGDTMNDAKSAFQLQHSSTSSSAIFGVCFMAIAYGSS